MSAVDEWRIQAERSELEHTDTKRQLNEVRSELAALRALVGPLDTTLKPHSSRKFLLARAVLAEERLTDAEVHEVVFMSVSGEVQHRINIVRSRRPKS